MRRTLSLIPLLATLLLAGLLVAFTSAGRWASPAMQEEPVLSMPRTHFNCADQEEIPPVECQALDAIHTALNFDAAGISWTTPCGRSLVTCRNGHVTSLRFGGKNLSGTIPSAIRGLEALTTIDLARNPNLDGFDEIHSFPALTRLEAEENNVGPFPSLLTTNTALEHLWLMESNVTGPLPDTLGDLVALQELLLYRNQISGTLPPSLTNLKSLQSLNLYQNAIEGEIPSSIANLTSLNTLILADNRFTGTIPSAIGSMPSLAILNLQDNRLRGSIPASLGNLAGLKGLYLNGNQLSGPVPATLGGASNLTRIHLDDNRLSGKLPPELANLTDLNVLRLGDNWDLHGPIPKAFEALTNVEIETLYSATQLCYGGPDAVDEVWADAHIASHLSLLRCDELAISGYIAIPDDIEFSPEEIILSRPRIVERPGVGPAWTGSNHRPLFGYYSITGTVTLRPQLNGYVFEPPARQMTVPPPSQNVTFTVRQADPISAETSLVLRGAGTGFNVCPIREPLRQSCIFELLNIEPGQIYHPHPGDEVIVPDAGGASAHAECVDKESAEVLLQILLLMGDDPDAPFLPPEFDELSVDETLTLIGAVLERICDEEAEGTPTAQAQGDRIALALQRGSVFFSVQPLLPSLQISTTTVHVEAGPSDSFGLAHDPEADISWVTVYDGDVTVTPTGTGQEPLSLQAGQQIQLGGSAVGDIVTFSRLYLPALLR